MFKKKALLVVFEGIEGSGKTYHCKRLYKKIIKLGLPSVITKEPATQKKHTRGWGRPRMRLPVSEKLEIIRLVERSHLSVG